MIRIFWAIHALQYYRERGKRREILKKEGGMGVEKSHEVGFNSNRKVVCFGERSSGVRTNRPSP